MNCLGSRKKSKTTKLKKKLADDATPEKKYEAQDNK